MKSADPRHHATSRRWSRMGFVVLLLVGLSICTAAIVYLYTKWEQRAEIKRQELAEQQERKLLMDDREAARKLVSPSEIEIVERRLLRRREPVSQGNLGAERIFTGRVRNISTKYELSAIRVELTVKDCVEDDCEIVGQANQNITLAIPPGQSRDFRETFYFTPTLGKPRGRFVWSHRVVQTCSNSGLLTLPCRDSSWYDPQ